MPLTVDLNKSFEENLKANDLPVGGGRRRRRRGGADEDESAEEKDARIVVGKVATLGLLDKAKKIGWDVASKSAAAAGFVGSAGVVIWLADTSFRPGLCDPLTLSLAKAIVMIPSAAGYAATCDSAAMAYNAAITTAALAVAPLVIQALKKVASIVVNDETVESVGDAIVDAVRDPSGAATRAVESRAAAKRKNSTAPPMPPPMPEREKRKYGGRRKTTKKSRTTKRKTSRRKLFAY